MESRPALPATLLITIYLVLLTLVPAGLVLPALGAAGTPANVFGIGLLVWWLCSTVAGQKGRVQLSPVHAGLALLALSVLLSYACGVANGWVQPADIHQVTDGDWSLVTVDELQRKSQLAALRGLLTVAGWLGIALVLCDGLRTWEQFDRVVTTVVWLSSAIALVGIIQFVTGENLALRVHLPGLVAHAVSDNITRSGMNRVQATATHPIEYGVVLAALFPLAIHHALHLARRRIDYLPVALVTLAVPMAVSRSGIVVLAAVLVILFLGWSLNRRLWTIVLLPVVLVAMRAAFPGLIGTIRSLFTSASSDPSVAGRTSDYGDVFGIYLLHPWFGRGTATFIPTYYRTLDNQFLMNLVELGLLGLVASVWLFVAAVYCARYVRRHATDPGREHVGLALSAGLVGIALSYATFDAWSFSMAAGTTFVLVGLAGGAWGLTREDLRRRTRLLVAVRQEAGR